jgi:hypothetical protein
MHRILGVVFAAMMGLGAVSAGAEDAEQKTVAGLYQDKAALSGHLVTVAGKVVKVNNGIMDRNFLHLKDGTGAEGTDDLTVTSQQTANLGDEVVVTGRVVVDKDFGAGYTYPVLLEEATIAAAKK